MSEEIKNPAKRAKEIEEQKKIIMQMFNSKNELTDINEKEETKAIDEIAKTWDMNDRITSLFADKIESDTNLKNKYAIILIGILVFQLISLNVIFILKGINILNFSDSTFNLFISGGIAEVFILVRTIVKYLSNDNLTELLKIIVRTSNGNSYKNKNRNKKS